MARYSTRKSCHLLSEQLEDRLVLAVVFINAQETVGEFFQNHDAALGDVDGDGDLDAFIASDSRGTRGSPNQVWLNDGEGRFSDSGQRLGSSPSEGIQLGDLDGDGDLDAFVANDRPASGRVWLNNGDGMFTDSGQELGSSRDGLALGDLDGDGDVDAFVLEKRTVWLNNGSGRFVDSGQRLECVLDADVALDDIDGDGDLDAVSGNCILLNDGQGGFSETGQSLMSHRAFGAEAIAMGDLDGDGDSDAFVGNRRIRVIEGVEASSEVWLNDGLGNFSDSGQRLSRGAHPSDVSLADLDDDGDLDAVVSGLPNEVFLNDGSGTFHLTTTGLDGRGRSVSLGDLDGDDDVDMLVLDHRNVIRVWLNAPMIGDANGDFRFDALDILQVINSGKYRTGLAATFEEGDWNVDGVFNQLDIVAALQTGSYLQ